MNKSVNKSVQFHSALREVETLVLPNRITPKNPARQAEAKTEKVEEQPDVPSVTNEHLTGLIEELNARVNALAEAQQQNLDELHEIAMELSMAVASHVVKQTLDANELNLNELVSQAIEQLLPASQFTVRIHPDDCVELESIAADHPSDLLDKIQLVKDAKLSRGACSIETEDHGLFSTLENRLDNLRDSLLQGIDYARTERRQTQRSNTQLQRFPNRRKPA